MCYLETELAKNDNLLAKTDVTATGYYVDGNRFLRVSNVCNRVYPFRLAPRTDEIRRQWDAARDNGTFAHSCISAWLTGTGAAVAETAISTSVFAQLNAFLETFSVRWVVVALERTIYSSNDNVYKIAGTFDALFYDTEKNEFVLVDWKYTPYMAHFKQEKHALQLNIYAMILETMYNIPVSRAYIVQFHESLCDGLPRVWPHTLAHLDYASLNELIDSH